MRVKLKVLTAEGKPGEVVTVTEGRGLRLIGAGAAVIDRSKQEPPPEPKAEEAKPAESKQAEPPKAEPKPAKEKKSEAPAVG